MKISKKMAILIGALIIICLVIALTFNKKEDKKSEHKAENAEQQASMTVNIVNLSQQIWPQEFFVTGLIAPYEEIIISPEISGYRLSDLYYNVGTSVKQGQLLAKLSDENLKKELAKQKAAVTQAQVNLEKAASDVRRAAIVGQSGALSAQQIEEYKINQDVAKANLDAAKAELDMIQLKISQTAIKAPASGIIYSKQGVVGNVVSAGTELYHMIKNGVIEWRAEVDASQSHLIKAGDLAEVTLPDQTKLTGTVRTVSPSVSTDTARSIVYVTLKGSKTANVGTFVDGKITIGQDKAYVLPQTAIVMRDGRSYIYVVNDKNIANSQVVETARRMDGYVEIVSPLASNLKIVETGGAFLTDGMTVKIAQKTTVQNTQHGVNE
ncbi:efflux RND transporter periplasmic adaptor subunit [Acinetobacter sp. ANC 5579]|uniref:efflux RND transporter periplasmic adaptor subunit n=1 Tax=Acinetobacter amyesii TaxID=2942470 RepID=UPI00201B44A1|nr:efflux RND transporter periplasmic adaptor subunit [Acinetobacter amyesii]MCL6233063.1 efflux RND transporter periplasmic adaptor subunit [Acinetobacter amyesii]MCL6235982.1 efflux RND transporter periplasmic adaptor subunit [Acinetobacter amyesii]